MSPPRTPAEARDDLAAWRDDLPRDPYGSDVHLAAANRRHLDAARRKAVDAAASGFGRLLVERVRPLVDRYTAHPPRLEKYDGLGSEVEEVVFDGAYHEAGGVVWGSGLLEVAAQAGHSFEQANLFYLASQEGEMGHMCAATCTTGIIRVLRLAGAADLMDRYLERLCSSDASAALRGAQYLTEVQGGSDVGANAVVASPQQDGTVRIDGEKWFCSVADADVFLVTARPVGARDGTRGLGCYLVPRHVAGTLNGFSIRRLKDKLGTTSMASGEIDFHGALGYPIGTAGSGFALTVEGMLNASRWLNAIGNVGIMRRAFLEASTYAGRRRAFGRSIGDFPAVQQLLAGVKVEWLAALHSTWSLTALDELVDRRAAGDPGIDPDALLLHRFLVNANKLVTSQACTRAVLDSIEVLGGNGAIESFSVLPRLLRDSVVYEQWEGTHNVLAAQIARDLGKLDLLRVVVAAVEETLGRAGEYADPVRPLLAEVRSDAERATADHSFAEWQIRRIVTRLMRVYQAALLLATAVAEPALSDELAAAAELLIKRHLLTGYRPEDDTELPKAVAAVLGTDIQSQFRVG